MKTTEHNCSVCTPLLAVSMALGFILCAGAGAATPWTPTHLETVLWLDAADTDTLSTDGADRVSLWENKGSAADADAVQTDDDLKPIYSATAFNSRPGLAFDSANDFMNLGTGLNLPARFLVIVAGKFDTVPDTWAGFMDKWPGSPNNSWVLTAKHDTSAPRKVHGAISTDGQNTSGTAILDSMSTAPSLYAMSGDGSNFRVWFNAVTGGTPQPLTQALHASTASVTLGNKGLAGITMSECIIVTGRVTTAERQLVEGYLAHKWGIEASLPDLHPHRNSAPTYRSFTFDFEHPDGTGSSFADAISLRTAGCMKDKNGVPIGFTHSTQSDGGAVEADVELTENGLFFETFHDPSPVETDWRKIALGVPFATDGAGVVKVTARFSGAYTGWDTQYEMMGLLLGSAATRGIGAKIHQAVGGHSLIGLWIGSTFRQSLTPDPWNNGQVVLINGDDGNKNITEMVMAGEATAGGTVFGTIVSDAARSGEVSDGESWPTNHLGKSGAYAYFLVNSGNDDADGFSGTLTSITFEGPHLVVPAAGSPNRSFTFDFEHPDAEGSEYPDAISLDTEGAIKDTNGVAVGFTVNNQNGGEEE